ncbi:hypothetical protein VHEMI07621 [[Torrubiella] hemipterigena]|uniref:Xylanolytic transcriptional activator regulatory domain-containing protein n=1 Tax=[Torrubiella] hemipterigena TaxID=1531966 RepID=A0A0A1TAY0_9HYPO|nr:hypothetical protein VHEMI07621 [[Torrubiella] hemipterigena]
MATPASDQEKPTERETSSVDPGTLRVHQAGTFYMESGHWEDILTKIRGLTEDFVPDKVLPGSHLIYGPNHHSNRDDIVGAVPPRPVVDRLMALHFDSYIITPFFIHSIKFLRETFTMEIPDGPSESLKSEYLTMKDEFRERAVQCLMLARYTNGGPYILETLITILTGESVLLKGSATDGWLSISTILHLAVRMGYHRDPDHFLDISPFEAEMRRRIWTTILVMDLTLSLDIGLPRNAIDSQYDTKLPQNLHDSDFDEDTLEIPPPRPETEYTPILPLIAKGRLIAVLGLICNANTTIKPLSYDETVKVDKSLQDIHSHAIPPMLRWDSAAHPITDRASLIVQRISLETSFHKSRILLYRRILSRSPVHQFLERERDSMLHEESLPLGRLSQLRWKVAHIFNQDILLATSVFCLYLQDVEVFESPQTGNQQSSRVEEIRRQLTISHKIWHQMSTTSAAATKVAQALGIVLGDTEVPDDEGTQRDLAEFDAIPLAEFDTSFNSECKRRTSSHVIQLLILIDFASGFHSPLRYFDNVLETWGT